MRDPLVLRLSLAIHVFQDSHDTLRGKKNPKKLTSSWMWVYLGSGNLGPNYHILKTSTRVKLTNPTFENPNFLTLFNL